MNPLHGIWRGKKQMQWCARFVRDLLCITFSKKHKGWQLEQAAFYLVFTNSQESEGMLWDKGLPTVSYLRASERLQLGKAFNETCGAGSVRNPTSREPAAEAVVPEELRDKDLRGQKKRKKPTTTQPKNPQQNKKTPPFSQERIALCWFKKPLKAAGFRARLERSKDRVGKGRFIFVFS